MMTQIGRLTTISQLTAFDDFFSSIEYKDSRKLFLLAVSNALIKNGLEYQAFSYAIEEKDGTLFNAMLMDEHNHYTRNVLNEELKRMEEGSKRKTLIEQSKTKWPEVTDILERRFHELNNIRLEEEALEAQDESEIETQLGM